MAERKELRSQGDWLAAGLHVLVAVGAEGLTVDGLCRRLGVTKGSFYHHFANHHAYTEALLAYWEQEHTLTIIRLSEQAPDPAARLAQLTRLVAAAAPELEIAIRAWALRDPFVRAYQARIDRLRLAYLQEVCLPLARDPEHAAVLARLLYSVYIGAHQMVPPLSADEQHQINVELLGLYRIPAEADP
ncbi:MAG TPA: TetR/AcrR family transcriptional regulator [Chloroflexia bacterium]|nr:TetR/AcrR family transcriptional regulator [Chloroflexia bacterium]